VSVKKVLLAPLHFKPRPSGVSLESAGLENIPKVLGNRVEVGQNHGAQGGLGESFGRKVKWSYISSQKLESEPSKSFAVSISLQTKAIRIPRDWRIVPKFREIEPKFVETTRRVRRCQLLYQSK